MRSRRAAASSDDWAEATAGISRQTAIPPARLPEFVEGFEEILEAHDTYASFYAHAGPGVLHVRPLVNTKTEVGLEQLHGIADDVTDLVVEL
ncbi:MAG: FAD-binding oxidoreductase, partial [Gemmatimonadota bacterium]